MMDMATASCQAGLARLISRLISSTSSGMGT